MDIVFKCTNPSCQQELAVDATAVGTEIECPTCGEILLVPEAMPGNTQETEAPVASAPAAPPPPVPAKEEKHFAVPQHSAPATLIKKPKPSLDVAAKAADKVIRVKTIKHGECQEVGKDHFDEVITAFVQKIGEENILSMHPISYSHFDVNIRQVLSDFGIVIVFKG